MQIVKEKIQNINVLFAEDDADNYFLLETYLRALGFKNFIGHMNGKDLMETLKTRNDIDLIILDIHMPILNGIECLNEIRKINKDMPVIALTAFALWEDERKFLSMGFSAYIAKPFRTDDMLRAITKSINKD